MPCTASKASSTWPMFATSALPRASHWRQSPANLRAGHSKWPWRAGRRASMLEAAATRFNWHPPSTLKNRRSIGSSMRWPMRSMRQRDPASMKLTDPTAMQLIKTPIDHFINGRVIANASGRTQDVTNPATGTVSGVAGLASAAQVGDAVAAAQAAFPAWADTPPIRRARVMFKFLQLLNEHKDELAHLITAEHGKVFTDAQGEVSRGIDIVEFACGIPQLLKGDYTDP